MVEIHILKYLCNRENYEKYSSIAEKSFLTKEATDLFKSVGKYYEEFSSYPSIMMKDVLAWELVKRPGMKPEKKEIYLDICEKVDELAEADIEESIVDILLVRDTASQILFQADRIESGEEDSLDNIYDLLKSYEKLSKKAEESETSLICETHPHDLFDPTAITTGWEWRLPLFNEAMGPLGKSNLVVISARPETGKTSMIASEATYIAEQMEEKEKVYWFCNEEPGEIIKRRIITAFLDKDVRWVAANRSSLKDELEFIHNKFVVCHGNLSMNIIERILKNGNPGLIIIDQLRKVHGIKNESEHLRLQKLFEWARGLALEYSPLFAVHQAGATGDGVLFMEYSDIHGSKTDIQGEADAIIMIGKEYSPGMENVRGIHIPKNKFISNDPSKRHAKEVVNINTESGRFFP